MRRIAYLGPQGTFSEQAAKKFLGEEQAEMFPCRTLYEVCRGVADGTYTQGVLPLENLLEGSVNPVLDLLLDFPLISIQAEIMLPVVHHLLARTDSTFSDIRTVLSHPQALAQCRGYLNRELPGAELVPVESTARAAQQVAKGSKDMAAIGSLATATHYQLQVLARDIQDRPNNCTRFVVVGLGHVPDQNASYKNVRYKTSLVISMIDRPGALYSILKEFSRQGINLTRIESRPAKTYLGEYIFFIDLEGHTQQPELKEALPKVAALCQTIRILGCYPACSLSTCFNYSRTEESLDQLRADIDIIDRQVIELLGKRLRLVRKIGKLKKNPACVRDPGREAQVISRIRRLAFDYGISEDVIESVYRILMDHFVDIQIKQITS
ncbi:prephenate dehydratase [Desulfotomaculum nigrificans]|uniref:prephenate dehydratase n=1 Tax=Desulfotomaculum nigrificans TaxID=1565 RepID=UPI0001FADF5E|nr:prephenate dehydratase [Desulfotomaculum nigrificans]